MKRQFDAACRQYQVKSPDNIENLWTNDYTWPSNGVSYDPVTQMFEITAGANFNSFIYELPTPIPAGTTITAAMFGYGGSYEASTYQLYGGAIHAGGSNGNSWQCSAGLAPGIDLTGSVYCRSKVTTDTVTHFALRFTNSTVTKTIRFRLMLVIGEFQLDTFKPYGVHKHAWADGLKSGLPSVKMFGKTEQQTYSGKNMFDVSRVPVRPNAIHVESDCVIVVNRTVNGYTASTAKLRDLAPNLVVGKQYTFSFETESSCTWIYLTGDGGSWRHGECKTVDEIMLESQVVFYGMSEQKGDPDTMCRISKIQIEEGETLTAYEPYIGGIPAPNPQYPQEVKANNATVRSRGLNALDIVSMFGEGYTKTLNGVTGTIKDGYAVFTGTHTNTGWTNVLEVTALPNGAPTIPAGTYSLPLITNGAFAVRLYDLATGASLGNKTGTFSIDGECEVRTTYIAFRGEQTVSLSVPLVLAKGSVPATSYEPYYDGGEATAPNLMCAADGSCQSAYDPQTGEFVNWWYDKLTFDGSDDENWYSIRSGDFLHFGFGIHTAVPIFNRAAKYWSNQTEPSVPQYVTNGRPLLVFNTPSAGSIAAYDFGFYDDTLEDKGLANWKAHLAEHPLEVWVARNEPEITNIGAQRLTCPTGFGQIIQVAGDIPDCPMEIKYLAHGGNVK